MGATFSRVKIWIKEKLLFADLNAEFDNVLNNLTPTGIDDHSVNVAQMQALTDPGTTGSESLATSLAGEIERIRYVIKRILGASATNWYDAPGADLSILTGASNELHVYLPMDSEIYEPSTSGIVGNLVNRGLILNPVITSVAGVRAADFTNTSGEVQIGSYAYTVGTRLGDSSVRALAYPGRYGSPYVGTLTAHFRNLVANDYIAFNPLTGHELFLDASGLLTARLVARTAASESSKTAFTVAGSLSKAGDTDYQTVAMKFRSNDLAGASTDLLELELDDAEEGTQLTAQNIDINGGDGGNWIFGAKKNDPAWDHFAAMSVTPDNHSSAWTANGTAGNGTVSGGILTIDSAAASRLQYSRTSLVNFSAGNTFEWKMRYVKRDSADNQIDLQFRDDSLNLSFVVRMLGHAIAFDDTAAAATTRGRTFYTPSQYDWHVYRVTASESGGILTLNLYIDGIHYGSHTHAVVDATAGDLIAFGERANVGTQEITEWEYFKIYDGGASPAIIANSASNGQLDDIALTAGLSSSSQLTSLQTVKASAVYGESARNGITLPKALSMSTTTGVSGFTVTAATDLIIGDMFFGGDGRTPLLSNFSGTFSYNQVSNSWEIRKLINFHAEDDTINDGNGLGGDYSEVSDTDNNHANDEQDKVLIANITPTIGLHRIAIVIQGNASGTIGANKYSHRLSIWKA